jgi:PPOX class probable F420-dependent enzyme
MTSLPDSARAVLQSLALAHLVTLDPDGSPQVSVVWAGPDGDEIVAGHLPEHRKVRNIRNDSRVALSIETGTRNAMGLNEYLVIYGTARITEGGAAELLQRLARTYLGPDVRFPPMDNPPPGHITHIRVDRISRWVPGARSANNSSTYAGGCGVAGTVPGTAARTGRGRGDGEPFCRQVSDATGPDHGARRPRCMEPGSRSRRWPPVQPTEQDRKLLALTPDEYRPRSVKPEPISAILIAEYLRLPSHWPQRAGEYRSAISERSKSGRAYRPSGGGPAWQSRGRVWRRVWAPS